MSNRSLNWLLVAFAFSLFASAGATAWEKMHAPIPKVICVKDDDGR